MVLYSVEKPAYRIIYKDDWLLAASKEAGIPSQHDKSGDPALIEMLEKECGGPLFVVHRIDRPASGLVLFARSAKTAGLLSELFRSAAVERRYWAIVGDQPEPTEATLTHRLESRPTGNKTDVVTEGGREATMKYAVVAKSERFWLLDVELVTGRHHQIRAQLAAIGCPIRGDLKYRARRSIPGGGIGLHAYRLKLTHPHDGRKLTFSAPAPDDRLWQALTEYL